MRHFGAWVVAAMLAALPAAAGRAPAPPPTQAAPASGTAPLIAVLCYHDLSNDPDRDLQTVSPKFLSDQIRSCKQAGWTFMSLSELMARRAHNESLPPRVMVLTFDDGYRSFKELALPILRAEGVKATIAIITSFVDHPPANLPPLMTWKEIHEVEDSGSVEVASHTHDLHRYEFDNPYRDTAPALSVRRYLQAEKRYENREEYRSRIRADLNESQRLLREHLGHPATTVVWPYGMNNEMSRGLAAQAGFNCTLALGWREARPEDFRIACLPRIMVTGDMHFAGQSLSWLREPQGAMRAARVSLDDLYDGDMTAFRSRLDALITHLRAIGATHVFLDACSNPVSDGRLERTYFPSDQTATRADLWSMTAAKLLNARLRVWVRTPSMNLTWFWQQHPDWRLAAEPHPFASAGAGGTAGSVESRIAKRWPTRLSPELPQVHRAIADYFTDLAVYLPIDGILFDDDAVVLPNERLASKSSADPAARAAAVDGLIADIESAVRAWRPECRFGRTVGAEAVLASGPARETSQDFAHIVRDQDRVIVRADAADPAFARDPARWTKSVCRRAMEPWRTEQRVRAARALAAGVPKSALDAVPPLMLELPVDGLASDAVALKTRLPLLLAEARRAGFESYVLGPVTPLNQDVIPPRVLEGVPVTGALR